MKNPLSDQSFRSLYFFGFAICAALYSYALYVQFDLHIEPCWLCIFQRIALIAMAVFFLLGAIHNPRNIGRRVYALLVLASAAAGVGFAAHHLWVQSQPPNPLAGCAPGFAYAWENFPINKVLKMAFTGNPDCAEVNWTFLGLAMPFWTLVSFVVLGAGAVWAGFRRTR